MSSASCSTRCIRWLGDSASPPLIFACLPDLTIVFDPRSGREERAGHGVTANSRALRFDDGKPDGLKTFYQGAYRPHGLLEAIVPGPTALRAA